MAPARRLPRRVACLLLPRWLVQVAAHDRPEVLIRPVVVVRDGVTIAVSEPAEAAGIRARLTEVEARAYCPGVLVLRSDPAAEAVMTTSLLPLLAMASPVVELSRPGVFFLDWGGLRGQGDGEMALARQLLGRLGADLGLAAVIGVADTPFPAAVAAHRRASAAAPVAIVPPGGSAAFLTPFPLRGLPGVGRHAPALRALGLHTLGDLARQPAAPLAARFGPAFLIAHRLASGKDARPLRPQSGPAERSASVDFDSPDASLDRLLFAARRLVWPLWDGIEADGLAADGLRLTLSLEGEARLTLALALPAGPDGGKALLNLLRSRLDDGGPLPAPVVGLEVSLTGVGPPRGRQLSVAEAGRAAWLPKAQRAAARLWALAGERGALRLAVRPALLPEDAVAARPWDDRPDDPPSDPACVAVVRPGLPGLRRVTPPRPVRVEVADGQPAALYDAGRRRPLIAADGPNRAVDQWWSTGMPMVDRDYWLVADAAGQLLVLVADRIAGGWRVVGELDA